MNRDTILYLCEVLKYVGDNYSTTVLTHESMSLLFAPMMFKPVRMTKDMIPK